MRLFSKNICLIILMRIIDNHTEDIQLLFQSVCYLKWLRIIQKTPN